jgi:hypothetical protein
MIAPAFDRSAGQIAAGESQKPNDRVLVHELGLGAPALGPSDDVQQGVHRATSQ